MLAVQAGDLVLEVNRVVVSSNTVDRVSTDHDAKIDNSQINLEPPWMVEISPAPTHPGVGLPLTSHFLFTYRRPKSKLPLIPGPHQFECFITC